MEGLVVFTRFLGGVDRGFKVFSWWGWFLRMVLGIEVGVRMEDDVFEFFGLE